MSGGGMDNNPGPGGPNFPPLSAEPAAAVVLAGGRGSRLGGADKAGVDIAGIPLIDHVLGAVASLRVVVVGPEWLARPGITVVREDPPYGGPVAAIAAGLGAVPPAAAQIWLLACDLPRARSVVELLSSAPFPRELDALLLRDASDRVQFLAGRYRVAALRRALAELPRPEGASMRELTRGLTLGICDDGIGAAFDLDTWDDVEAYRRTLRDRDR